MIVELTNKQVEKLLTHENGVIFVRNNQLHYLLKLFRCRFTYTNVYGNTTRFYIIESDYNGVPITYILVVGEKKSKWLTSPSRYTITIDYEQSSYFESRAQAIINNYSGVELFIEMKNLFNEFIQELNEKRWIEKY